MEQPEKGGAAQSGGDAMATQKFQRPLESPDPGVTTRTMVTGPVRFPVGERLLPKLPFREEVFETVHDLIEGGQCVDGRFEIETRDRRLTCLIHRGKLHFAGLQEGDVYSQVPLADLPLRARELRPASCRLLKSDPTEVLIAAVHFAKQPALRGSVRFVDPARVLRVLAEDQRDAALSFLRGNGRTLLFLHRGKPARLFFANPKDDPGEGSLEERMLLFAFGPQSEDGVVEVFTDLRLPGDPDAGTPLRELVSQASPAPPATVYIHMDGHEVRQRPFTAPSMVIGRDPKVDLFIDNLGVSRRHALLSWNRGAFHIEDLGSSNGTFIGDSKEKIAKHELVDGEVVRIGKFEVTVVRTRAEQQAAETMFVSRMNLQGVLPPPLLRSDRAALALERELLIGKGDGVDLVAQGWRVGAVHAKVSPTDTYGKIRVDCFGNLKITVDRKSVGSAVLGIDEAFRVGRTTFRLEPAGT